MKKKWMAYAVPLTFLLAWAGYVLLKYRQELNNWRFVAIAMSFGVLPLMLLIDAVAHGSVGEQGDAGKRRARRIVAGSAVLIMMVLGSILLFYGWRERSDLRASSIFPFFDVVLFLAVAAIPLTVLLFSMAGPSRDLIVMRAVMGIVALVTTVLAGVLLTHCWKHRQMLREESGGFLFLALIGLAATGAAAVSWVGFWKTMRRQSDQVDEEHCDDG